MSPLPFLSMTSLCPMSSLSGFLSVLRNTSFSVCIFVKKPTKLPKISANITVKALNVIIVLFQNFDNSLNFISYTPIRLSRG